jgi:hypothetical protein
MLSVAMLKFVILSVVKLSLVIPSVKMQSFIILNVVKFECFFANVVRLSVVRPNAMARFLAACLKTKLFFNVGLSKF